MKRLISVMLAVFMTFSLLGCGKGKSEERTAAIPQQTEISDLIEIPTPEPTEESTPIPTPEPTIEATPEPQITSDPEPEETTYSEIEAEASPDTDLETVSETIPEKTEATPTAEPTPEPTPEVNVDREKLLAATVSFVTDKLEYSKKKVDPLTLIKVDDSSIQVTAENEIDLTEPTEQTVIYNLSSGDESIQIEKVFSVTDNKEAVIKLKSDNVVLEYGKQYDPGDNVLSVTDEVDGELKRVPDEDHLMINTYLIEGSYDPNKAGKYLFTVTACDSNTNFSKKEFTVTVEPEPYQEPKEDYIANKKTKKFHYTWCSSVNQMKESNMKVFEGVTREYMIKKGYKPCGRCNP